MIRGDLPSLLRFGAAAVVSIGFLSSSFHSAVIEAGATMPDDFGVFVGG